MSDSPAKALSSRKPLLLFVGLGLALMLGSALSYFLENPSLIRHPAGRQEAAMAEGSGQPGTPNAMPGGAGAPAPDGAKAGPGMVSGMGTGMDEAGQNAMMQLMQRLQQNPQDTEALRALAEHFMHLQDWPRAETFALRAMVAAPGDHTPLYLLGIIQHNQQRHAEAATSLEKAVALHEEPSIRYSLGMLYAYFLNKPEQGLAQMEKVLTSPNSPEPLQKTVRVEMEKIKQHQAHGQK